MCRLTWARRGWVIAARTFPILSFESRNLLQR
jgi:hypothetical protein